MYTLAMDEAESAYEFYVSVHGRKKSKKDPELAELHEQAKALHDRISSYIQQSKGALLSRWIMKIPEDLCDTAAQVILAEVALDDEFQSYPRLKLLIAHWSAHELRLWTNKLKNRRLEAPVNPKPKKIKS
jgi:hypothetical protein